MKAWGADPSERVRQISIATGRDARSHRHVSDLSLGDFGEDAPAVRSRLLTCWLKDDMASTPGSRVSASSRLAVKCRRTSGVWLLSRKLMISPCRRSSRRCRDTTDQSSPVCRQYSRTLFAPVSCICRWYSRAFCNGDRSKRARKVAYISKSLAVGTLPPSRCSGLCPSRNKQVPCLKTLKNRLE